MIGCANLHQITTIHCHFDTEPLH